MPRIFLAQQPVSLWYMYPFFPERFLEPHNVHFTKPYSSLFINMALPACKYGSACYRKNPNHFREYSHPTGAPPPPPVPNAVPGAGWAMSVQPSPPPPEPSWVPIVAADGRTYYHNTTTGAVTWDNPAVPVAAPPPPPGGGGGAVTPAAKPPCKYGSACYRKNPNHFHEYSHPHGAGGAHGGGGGGGGAVAPAATPCKYGSACYRMGNPDHVLKHSHPAGSTTTYVMYHGTSRAAAEDIERNGFKQSADGMLGRGVYVSRDPQKAAAYKKGADGVIFELRVKCGRTKKIDRQGHELQKTWHQAGYDSAWVPAGTMNPSGMQENCIWDPSRIRVVRRMP